MFPCDTFNEIESLGERNTKETSKLFVYESFSPFGVDLIFFAFVNYFKNIDIRFP